MTNTYTHSYKPKSKIMTTTTTTLTTKTKTRKILREAIKILVPDKMIKPLSMAATFQMLRWTGTNSSYKMPLHKARSQGR